MVSCADSFIKKQWEQVKPLPGLKANTSCRIRRLSVQMTSLVLCHPAPVCRETAGDSVKLAFARQGEGVVNPYVISGSFCEVLGSIFCLGRYYKKPIIMPMEFRWYVCVQQVIPGALGPCRPFCFTSTHSTLPNQSCAGTHLHTEPYVSPRAVSGEAYSWVCPLCAKPGSISACPSKAKLEPVHELCISWGVYPGEWVSQPSREAILSSSGAPKGDACTSAELFSCEWALIALHLHGNPSPCNREWWSNISRL